MALHKNLSGSDIHEPKGIETATAGQAYVSDGAGSGAWTDVLPDRSLHAYMSLVDVSTPSSTFTVAPHSLEVYKIYLVLEGTITGSDSTVTFYINGTPMTGGVITVTAAGSVAGSVFTCEPSAANLVTAGDVIKATTDGASSTAVRATMIIDMRYV